jgi:hypothetical protein
MWFVLAGAIACASPAAEPSAGSANAGRAGAFDHDHAAFAAVLQGAARSEGVDYATIGARRAGLDAYLSALAEAPVATFTPDQQLALWVNAYNGLTLRLVVDAPGIASIRDLDGGEVWKRRTFRVGGQDLTLDQIEHERARKLTDGRVHAVLSCASRGCPPLPAEPLRAATVDAQLTRAATAWARGNAAAIRGDTVYLSEIFKWFPEDFALYRRSAIPGANEAQTRALWFIATFGDPDAAGALTAGGYGVAWEPYDWALNRSP